MLTASIIRAMSKPRMKKLSLIEEQVGQGRIFAKGTGENEGL
jgi:hypothetical protein